MLGCYDVAEVCELVGPYILHKLSLAYPDRSICLYRDDRLGAFKKTSARSVSGLPC